MAAKKRSSISKMAFTLLLILPSLLEAFNNVIAFFKLEVGKTTERIILLIILSIFIGGLLISSWFCLLAMFFLYLISLHWSSTLALFTLFMINLLLLIVILFILTRVKRNFISPFTHHS